LSRWGNDENPHVALLSQVNERAMARKEIVVVQVHKGKLISGDRRLNQLPRSMGGKAHMVNDPRFLSRPYRRHAAVGFLNPDQMFRCVNAVKGKAINAIGLQPIEGVPQMLVKGGSVGGGGNFRGQDQAGARSWL
jgi:hypothetical protein